MEKSRAENERQNFGLLGGKRSLCQACQLLKIRLTNDEPVVLSCDTMGSSRCLSSPQGESDCTSGDNSVFSSPPS